MSNLLDQLKKQMAGSKKWVLWVVSVGITLLLVLAAALKGQSRAVEDPFSSPGRMLLDVGLKLALVLGLILVAAFVVKRFRQGAGFAPAQSSRKLIVRETVNLAPNCSLHLIQVGEDVMLIGATDQSVQLLNTFAAGTVFEPGDTPSTFDDVLSRQLAENDDLGDMAQ